MNPQTEAETTAAQVLIVDDDPSICKMLSQRIERAGYVCHTAANGKIAQDLLLKVDIAVVITDISMPGIDGVELTRRIKADFEADVIIMTGHFENFTFEEIIAAGASDFVQKPVGGKELILRLKRVLRECEQLAQKQQALAVI